MANADNRERKEAKAVTAVDEVYSTLSEYHINRRRVVFLANDKRRAGGYGIVRKAHLHASSYLPTWLASGRFGPPQLVAVKEIKLSAMHELSGVKRAFTKEVLVWSRIKEHPGVAKFLGFCADFDRSEAWLISPWEPYGNVREFICGRKLEIPEKLSLAYDTIDALEFLHQLEPAVIHGDIKSANVLVNLECRAVLCDFGLSRLCEDSGFARLETTTTFKGSIRWCSPELLDGQPRTTSSDIYAWAWLIWEIMTGELPYEGAGAEYVIIRKIFENIRPQVDGESRLNECLQLWELMTRCWAVEPLQRPNSVMCKTTVNYLPHCPPTSQAKISDTHLLSPALLENLGELESWKGNHKAGFAYLEQALHLYEKEGNEKGIASVLRKEAVLAARDSNHVKAMRAASAALEKCRSLQDDVGVADSLLRIGCSFLMENKRVEALRNLEESLKIFRAKGSSVDLARCLERLGELHRRDGQYAKALPNFELSVDIASRCGDRLGEARALTAIGVTNWALSNKVHAISSLQKAHDIAKNIGWEQGLSSCLCRMGIFKLELGVHEEAKELLRESVRVARRCDTGVRLAQALYYSGKCSRVQGRLEEAISALVESCSVYQHLARDFDPALARAATLLADSKSDLGHKEDALTWYDRAIAEYRKCPDQGPISECLSAKGIILVDMNRCDEGVLHLEASLTIDQEVQDEDCLRWNQKILSGIPKTLIKWEVRG